MKEEKSRVKQKNNENKEVNRKDDEERCDKWVISWNIIMEIYVRTRGEGVFMNTSFIGSEGQHVLIFK